MRCAWCGGRIASTDFRRRYCTDECLRLSVNKRQRIKYHKVKQRDLYFMLQSDKR